MKMRREPIRGDQAEARKGQTIYPEPFAQVVAGRTKRKLGDIFGLTNFGVNLTHLEPGAASALLHWHQLQDEFVFVLEGTATVVFGDRSPGESGGYPNDDLEGRPGPDGSWILTHKDGTPY